MTDADLIFCQICDRGEMFERLIYDRSKAVFEYFNLPFDAPPPPPETR